MAGANSRHAALIEDAFGVLVETPGGGVSLSGDARSRASAKRAVEAAGGRVVQGPDEIPGGEFSLNCIHPQGAAFGLVGVRPG